MIKLYYSPEMNVSEEYRIIPPPNISINQNMNYSNDVIIGYNYTITLNGYASNYTAIYDETLAGDSGTGPISAEDTLELITENDIIIITNNSQIIPTISGINLQNTNSRLLNVLYSVDLIKKIFSYHGNTLTIRDDQNNNILVAKGGILRSLSFSSTSNQWSKYASYSASLEFNELLLFDENITCSNGYINTTSITNNLVNINEYKISSFTDGWSFNIEDSALNYALSSDNNSVLDVYNTAIGVSYNLSATGKNYYIDDQFIPGWIQAKNFVQKRLYDQITNIDKILSLNGLSCNATQSLNTIHNLNSTNLIQNISSNYSLYNEIISCNTSESDGTFGINYSATLKINENGDFSDSSVIHNFTKDYSFNKEGSKTSVSININGTIEGLCNGGIVSTGGNFSLPQNGTLIFTGNNNTKFTNALNFLPKIINGTDLTANFKTALDINATALAATGVCVSGLLPSSFSLTKNYMEGNITYDVEYTTDKACSIDDSESVTNTTIDVSEPVTIFYEVAVPNGNYIIQDIGTVTAKTISVSVEGKVDRDCNAGEDIDILVNDYANETIETLFPNFALPDENEVIITEKSFSIDPLMGSYSIDLAYICSSGCSIS